MGKTRDVLADIDAVLGANQPLELDLMMDRVFPPGEQRNAKRYDLAYHDLSPEDIEWGYDYPEMVGRYVYGFDPEGEDGMGFTELIQELYGTETLMYDLHGDRRATPREQDWGGFIGDGFGYWKACGATARVIDTEWLAVEARWLEDHSQP